MMSQGFQKTSHKRLTPWAMLVVAWWAAAAARGAVVYGPPDSAADVAGELRVLEREIADGNFPAAARRVGTLLAANRGDALTGSGGAGTGTFYTLAAWIEQLPPEPRKSLAEAQRRAHEDEARRALEALRAAGAGSATPEELYAVARRFPLTASAAAALALAGDRAMELGDFPGALVLYERAARDGAPIDDVRVKRVELLRKLAAGDFLPAPADLVTATGGGATTAPAGKKTLWGLVPFDAPWYGDGSEARSAKFFPYACGDRVVLGTWKSVTMFGDNGQVVWTTPNPRAASFSAERPTPSGRGVVFGAGVLPDVHGRPAVVVVRQPASSPGEARFEIRAYRGGDGKLLWTSDAAPDGRKDVTYAGLPAVCGRYVYGVAAVRNDRSSGTLLLSALDVTRGEVIWQASLGSIMEQSIDPRGGRKNIVNAPLDLASLADVTEPAVAGDLVIVSAGCGAVIAVGRFDGKVRWVHHYRGVEPPPVEQEKFRDRAERDRLAREREQREREARDVEKALLLRYRSTPAVCEGAVVAMPQDVGVVVALDRATGRRLWHREKEQAYGVAGAVAGTNVAVLSGRIVAGVDALTGVPKWTYFPPAGAVVTGPAVVAGRVVLVPVTSGVVQLDGPTGKEVAAGSRYALPNLRRALATDAGKAMLREAGAEGAFGMPDSAR